MADAMQRVVTFIATVLLQLRNGSWVEGRALRLGEFIVLTQGKEVVIGANSVKAIKPVEGNAVLQKLIQSINNSNQRTVARKEKEKMEVFHFVKMVDGVARRIITNNPSDRERDAVAISIRTHAPVGDIMALDTGDWEFNFLIRMFKERGNMFRVVILPNKEVANTVLVGLGNWATFAWANASYSFFLHVEGAEWGLDALGLKAFDTLKISKRLQEVCRLSEMHWYGATENELKLMVYPRPDWMDAKLVDGKSFISKAFALKMAYSISNPKRRRKMINGINDGIVKSFSIRVMGPFGLIKGDAYIHSDANCPHDIITDLENIKTDITTDGYVFATLWEHHTLGRAKWDDQSSINFNTVLPAEHRLRDLQTAVALIRSKFENGEVPEDLMLPEDAHTDDGVPNMERLSDMLRDQRVRWQASGLDIRMAQNLMYMWLNGFIKAMERDEAVDKRTGRGTGEYKKTHLPMSNAFYGTVATFSLLTKMGGYRFYHEDGTLRDGSEVFFDERFGLVIPDQRFIDTFDLHGTWDLDDTVKAIIVKVFGDANEVARLKNNFVLPADVKVGASEDEATTMVAFVRSPNGPGEISFEIMDEESMPWFGLDRNNITKVNLATIISQSEFLSAVPANTLPTSITYTKSALTRAQAMRMIIAQQSNPDIGGTANALMVWYNTFHSMPVMADTLGSIVDAVQQGSDIVTFKAVENGLSDMWTNFENAVKNSRVTVDRHLMNHRGVPSAVRNALAHRVGDGRLTVFNREYRKAIVALRDEVMNKTLQMRQDHPMTADVTALNFQSVMPWAGEVYARWTNQLKAVDMDQRYNTSGCDPFTARTLEVLQSQARKQVVSGFIAELLTFERPFQRTLALWRYILTPDKGVPHGRLDRVMFQPGHDGVSVMDMLIEALVQRGWATALPE